MSQLLPAATRHTLFTWTYGHPFYVYAVTERMRAMSLSRRLKRSTGVTRNHMNRLIEVDLVVQRDGTFDLRDPVLNVWLASFHAGVELLIMPRQDILAQLVADMDERFQRISSELGLDGFIVFLDIIACLIGARQISCLLHPGGRFGPSLLH